MAEASPGVPGVVIRPLRTKDELTLAQLHALELPTEFISGLGPGFLTRYHRAFAQSPYATALVAADSRTDEPVGALFGTFDNSAHSAYLVRHHGPALAGFLLTRAVGDPKLAGELLKTRAGRYIRGLIRLSTKVPRRLSGRRPAQPAGVGVLCHVAVNRERQRRGVGASLLAAFTAQAVEAGVEYVELVTLPDRHGAGAFYERLGWWYAGERTSRSGETFSLYRLRLPKPGGPPD